MLNSMTSALKKELMPALLDGTNLGAKEREMKEGMDRTLEKAVEGFLGEMIAESPPAKKILNMTNDAFNNAKNSVLKWGQ